MTIIDHNMSFGKPPFLKVSWTISTSLIQLELLPTPSLDFASHFFRCSPLITDGLPGWLLQRFYTSSVISSISGIFPRFPLALPLLGLTLLAEPPYIKMWSSLLPPFPGCTKKEGETDCQMLSTTPWMHSMQPAYMEDIYAKGTPHLCQKYQPRIFGQHLCWPWIIWSGVLWWHGPVLPPFTIPVGCLSVSDFGSISRVPSGTPDSLDFPLRSAS